MSTLPLWNSAAVQPQATSRERLEPGTAPPWWALVYFAVQVIFQLALLVPGVGAFRAPMRIAAFMASLSLAAFFYKRERFHPAWRMLVVVGVLLILELLHPAGAGLVSAFALIGLYMAIAAPIFWVSGLDMNAKWFRILALTFWGWALINSLAGVIQVARPGSLQFTPSIVFDDAMRATLQIEVAGGAMIYRPMGLTDQPGAASAYGLLVLVLGSGVFLTERNLWLRGLAVIGWGSGAYNLITSHVRSLLVMAIVGMIVISFLLWLRGAVAKGGLFIIMLVLTISVGVSAAVSAGGSGAVDRLVSLVSDDPRSLYYSNRGHFLEYTFAYLLPSAPIGSGLGRWGMIYTYFHDFGGADVESIWCELQWTAWAVDGGWFMVLAYGGAMLAAMIVAFRIVKEGSDWLAMWAVVVLAYDLSIFAMTFNAAPFAGTMGVEFWLLNASLYGAWVSQKRLSDRAAA